MIAVDTSAVISVLSEEPDAERFRAALAFSDAAAISAVSLVEASMVASRSGDVAARSGVDGVLRDFEITVVAVDETQASIAREAFLRFGKGRKHPAQLNICDCFAYALAKSMNAPLLFKGDDFSKTDIAVAEVQ